MPVRRIGVFRALQLGDMLCAVPALRALRAAYPDAEITLVGLTWAREFAVRFGHLVDGFVAFPGHPGMPEQDVDAAAWPDYLATVRALRFDLGVQMHGDGTVSNRLVAEWRPLRMAAFGPAPDGAADRGVFIEWLPREHEVMRYVRLVRSLGVSDRGLHLEWPETLADAAEADSLMTDPGGGRVVLVHPGARLESRRWPVERFAGVADGLACAGARIFVTGAPGEAALADRLQETMRASATNLVGRTSLGGLAALVRRSALIVCNDTGVSHVAAAVGTSSVVVCCGADPVRWAPLDGARHAVLHHPVACRPCMHTVCPIGHTCATGVEIETVLDHAMDRLSSIGIMAKLSDEHASRASG